MLLSVFLCVSFRGEEFSDNILQATANLKTVNVIPALGELGCAQIGCENAALLLFKATLCSSKMRRSSWSTFSPACIDLVSTSPSILPSGLNVHSMLKHEAVVLTLDTVRFLEEKLLWHNQRYTPLYPFRLPYSDL